MKRCLGCMEEYEENLNICPNCEYKEDTPINRNYCLLPGTILNSENNNYLIGKSIDADNSGVVYIAWDNAYKRKVVIREYMPSEFSTRYPNNISVAVCEEEKEHFEMLMDKFVYEAYQLRKIDDDGIIKIFDVFYQNNTAYIVMEYVEGITLSEFMIDNGKLNPKIAIDLLMPIMLVTEKIHSLGEIHKTIHTENIMVTKTGSLKLLDLNFVRYELNYGYPTSCRVLLGLDSEYLALELWRKNRECGTYSDIYSLAAILYKMITSNKPEYALDRSFNLERIGKDSLEPIKKFNKEVPKNIKNAIYNGMNIEIQDRTQTVRQFIEELTSDEPVELRVKPHSIIDRIKQKLR